MSSERLLQIRTLSFEPLSFSLQTNANIQNDIFKQSNNIILKQKQIFITTIVAEVGYVKNMSKITRTVNF